MPPFQLHIQALKRVGTYTAVVHTQPALSRHNRIFRFHTRKNSTIPRALSESLRTRNAAQKAPGIHRPQGWQDKLHSSLRERILFTEICTESMVEGRCAFLSDSARHCTKEVVVGDPGGGC